MEHSLKHNVSITIDQKLFREIEDIRGREKRSTFIEHLIQTGLKNYKTSSPTSKTPYTMPRPNPREPS
jgi:metal-responsive CopG/Arc/MetJ family transcriptional regulator